MRRRIVLLVAATTSAVVVGFLVPMCLLIINLANDRAESQAREQAQLVAGLIASVPDDTTLAAAVSSISRAGLVVTVVRADENLIGASSLTDDTRTSVQRARKDRQPFTATLDHGLDAVVPVTTTNGVDVVIATVWQGQPGVPTPSPVYYDGGDVGATLLARQLARRVTTPVTAVAATAHRLREGELTARARSVAHRKRSNWPPPSTRSRSGSRTCSMPSGSGWPTSDTGCAHRSLPCDWTPNSSMTMRWRTVPRARRPLAAQHRPRRARRAAQRSSRREASL